MPSATLAASAATATIPIGILIHAIPLNTKKSSRSVTLADRERAVCFQGGDGVELLEAAFDRHVYDRHTHDAYAIGVTLHGVQRFWCRNRTHDSTPGHVIVISPGEVHDGRSGAAGGYRYRMFYIRPDRLGDVLLDVVRTPSDVGADRPLFPDPDLFNRLNLAWRAVAHSPGSLAADELLLRSLTALAVRGVAQPRREQASRHDRTLQRIRDYLHDHVDHAVSVQQLATIAMMSRFRLTRVFQQAYGLPLHAYHLHARLEEAKRRLACGRAIADVSADLGFVDQSHFHRRFKGSFGMTPGAWRAAHGYKTTRSPIAQHVGEGEIDVGRGSHPIRAGGRNPALSKRPVRNPPDRRPDDWPRDV
jgi:AraC-like DNA-binding protein